MKLRRLAHLQHHLFNVILVRTFPGARYTACFERCPKHEGRFLQNDSVGESADVTLKHEASCSS